MRNIVQAKSLRDLTVNIQFPIKEKEFKILASFVFEIKCLRNLTLNYLRFEENIHLKDISNQYLSNYDLSKVKIGRYEIVDFFKIRGIMTPHSNRIVNGVYYS